MTQSGWYVSAKAAHRSLVGPFATAVEAATFAQDERPPSEGWTRIAIYYRSGRKR